MMLPRIAPLLLVIVLATACQDPAERLAEHRARGDEFHEAGEYAEAVIEYKSALQIDPNLADVHYALFQSYDAMGLFDKAVWELQETVRLAPANLDAKNVAAEVLVHGQDLDQIQDAAILADELVALDPTRVGGWLVKGKAHHRLKEFDAARAAYTEAVRLDAENADAVRRLADLLTELEELTEAERLYRRATGIAPDLTNYRALAAFYQRQRRGDDAEAAFRGGLANATEDERELATILLAGHMISRERLEDAEQVLRDGVASLPESLDLLFGLARLYHSQGRRAEAEAVIQQAIAQQPDDPRFHLMLSTYRAAIEDREGALDAAEGALGVAPDDRVAKLRKAELLLDRAHRSGDRSLVAEAKAITDAMLEVEARPEALFVSAKVALAESRTDDAIATLRRLLGIHPNEPRAHFLLGSTYLIAGDLEGARNELSRALELDARLLEARRMLARIYARLGEDENVVLQAHQVLKVAPSERPMRVLLARSQARLGRPEEALRELSRIPETERDAEVEYTLARVLLQQDDAEAALPHLLAAAEKAPTRVDVLETLLRVQLRMGTGRESVTRIEQAADAAPEDPALLKLRATTRALAGRTREAEADLRRVIELDPNDLEAYERLAALMARSGRFDEMFATVEGALAAQPDSASLNLLVGTLDHGLGRTDRAMKRYETALRIDPELAAAKNNLAYLLAERGEDLDRALVLARGAKLGMPENPNAADTLGWVLFQRKQYDSALFYLKEAERTMAPDDPTLGFVRYHLAAAYEASGRVDDARALVTRALADVSSTSVGAEPPWVAEMKTLRSRLAGAPTL